MDEDAIMRLVSQNDIRAFEWVVKTYEQRLLRFATRLMGNSHCAQDAVQEAFLRLWGVIDHGHYQRQGSLEAFLFRIVRNVCLDQLRSQKSARQREINWNSLKPEQSHPEEIAQQSVLATAIQKAVLDLPEAQRSVFILSHYEELSYQEIATILECPVGTVSSRKRLAVDTLRKRLGSWRESGEPS